MIDYSSSQLLWPIVTSISSVAHLNGRNDILVPIISCSLVLLDLLRGYRVFINSGLIITILVATLIDYKYARRNVILFAIAALICTTLLLDINMTLNLDLATEPDPQLALVVDVLKFFVFVMHFFKSGRVYTLFMWLSTIPTSAALISFFLQRLLGASESEVHTLVADYALTTISYFLLLSGVLIDLGLINKSRTDTEGQSPTKETTPSSSLQVTQEMSQSDDESSDSEIETQITPTVSHVARAKEEALHIIVASSDKEHNERLSEMIKTLGHFSLVVDTGEHLFDILQGQTFAALFVDLSLEGALQHIDRIRRKEKLRLPLRNSKSNDRRPMPIIAMSNQLSTQEKEECMQMGLTDYISKPVKELTLDKILREQMSRTETHEPVSSVARFKLAQAARDPSSGRKTARQGQHSPSVDSNSEALRKVTQELEQLQKTFNFFVPPEYQELISLDGVSKLQLGDTICKSITVLFSDIRDFTTMSESMFINDLMEFLNTYLAFALPPVSEHGGFIDKFIGDSIMCIFAKPDPVEQTLGAVNCAVRMMRNLDFMAESGFNPTETGIGINTGRTIVGILGTETRMAPTALGDTVNLASRTESLCKRYGARILITEYTKEKMGPQSDELYTIRQVDHVTVKGKSSACRMYEVIDGDSEAIQALKKSILPEYNKGLEAFAQKHFELALASFNNCTAIYPQDKPSLIYVERCKELLAKIDELDLSQWEPVYKLSEK